MEKYSGFTDQKSGNNPFLPQWALAPSPPVFLRILIWILIKPILILLRLPTLLISLLLLAVLNIITLPLYIHPPTLRRTHLFLQKPAWRLLLASFGIMRITMECADARRLRVQSDRVAELAAFRTETDCELLFSNFTGPGEIFFLQAMCRPIFVIPACVGKAGGGSYYVLGFFQMLKRSLSHDSHLPPPQYSRKFDSLVELHKFCKKSGSGAPVVLFPEAAKSNGTAILEWNIPERMKREGGRELIELLKENARVIGFQYGGAYTPVHTVYSGLYHLFLLMQSLRSSLTFRWTLRAQVHSILNYLPTPDPPRGAKGSESAEPYFEALRIMQARMLPGVVLSNLDGLRSADFAEYFAQTQSMRYVKKLK